MQTDLTMAFYRCLMVDLSGEKVDWAPCLLKSPAVSGQRKMLRRSSQPARPQLSMSPLLTIVEALASRYIKPEVSIALITKSPPVHKGLHVGQVTVAAYLVIKGPPRPRIRLYRPRLVSPPKPSQHVVRPSLSRGRFRLVIRQRTPTRVSGCRWLAVLAALPQSILCPALERIE